MRWGIASRAVGSRRSARVQQGANSALVMESPLAKSVTSWPSLTSSSVRYQERGIVGETPNLAARLQGVAEPNTVAIAESTRSLLGNLFDLQDLGAHDLKGIAPVRAWAALRPASVESRFEALHASGLTALVGREEELELLLRRWSRAKTGEGQVVLLSGEAGIGKSRLTAALLEKLTDEPHTRLRYFCSPQHTDSALYPVINQMERAAGLVQDDTGKAKLDKLDTVLSQTTTRVEDAALFAEMLSLPNDGHYPPRELAPEQRRQRTLEALVFQMETLARQNPVLMIFEDAHWTDPTTLELFGRLVDRIRTLRVLLLVTFRSEFQAPWVGRPYVTALTINRLAEREISAMIDRVVGNKLLPANVRQDIIERTDGIPLFVEETTKAVLEAGSEGAAQRTAAAIPSPTLAVPASLQASLMARLDRLGPAREIAQIGAAIGREFSHALLAAVVHKPEVELASALDRLMAAALLFRHGVPPHAAYLFKHALVQEAAYSSLLREPRRALHARIADTLQSSFTEMTENQPEVVARHCTEAGLVENDTKGYAAVESKAAVERASLLIEQGKASGESPEDPLLLFTVLNGLWLSNYVAFNGDAICEIATQFLALAEREGATFPLMIGHRLMGTSLTYTGDPAGGRAHFDRAIRLWDTANRSPLSTRFGQAILTSTLADRAFALWMLGYPRAALADNARALEDAREIGHAAPNLYALGLIAVASLFSRDYAVARAQLEELAPLAEKTGSVFWTTHAKLMRGSLHAVHHRAADAINMITSGITELRLTGGAGIGPFYLGYLAEAYRVLHQLDEAWRAIDEAISLSTTTKERCWEAHLCRIAGELSLNFAKPEARKAESYFDRALSVARQQQAKSLELRAAMSMARLWRDQGKRDEARDLLAPVYGWFTEGFDTLDLKEAKALLDDLAA
jgi:tetratricopeptide (TPR) repeat protein